MDNVGRNRSILKRFERTKKTLNIVIQSEKISTDFPAWNSQHADERFSSGIFQHINSAGHC